MIRPLYWAAAAVAAVTLASLPAAAQEAGRLVDPFVGTLGDFGQLAPAASSPYGMVQLAPDTSPGNHAGYDFAATSLTGFSHTRFPGVGCGGAGGDVRAMLTYRGEPAVAQIDKRSEHAHAGYYSVRYGSGIRAELTATRGAGIIRFTVPRSGLVNLRVDFAGTFSRHHGAQLQASPGGDLRGSFSAGTVCDAGVYHLHSASVVTRRGRREPVQWTLTENKTASTGLAVRAGDVIELRTGLSTIDPDAAAGVRRSELGSASFAAIAAQVLRLWNEQLARVTIKGTREELAMLNTALFRVMQSPVAVADPDGRFRGSDGRLASLPRGEQHYSGWAMWDNYRTQMPLLALIDPGRAEQIARSLVRLYQSGKQRWATSTEPFLTVRTEHAGIALLDFQRKCVGRFDAHAALEGMIAESPGLARVTPDEQIEAAYDDWAIAELAADLGLHRQAAHHRALALSYRPMWLATFSQLGDDADVVKARGLYQGTLAQYRWAPVFDLPWIKQQMGERFSAELNRFFAENLFNMTNQPDIHVPYLLAWSGAPEASFGIVDHYLTREMPHRYTNSAVRREPWLGRSFAFAPQGFADGMDDDAGTMTAWYVWATFGLYPLTPGIPSYQITSPRVSQIVIRPNKGQEIVLTRTSPGAVVINGRTARGTVSHAELTGSPSCHDAQSGP